VDLSDPTRAVTSTLDGPVLAVLAGSGKPMSVGEVAALTPRGSEVGVRKSLGRLVDQGIVRATEMGRNRVHELNRDHVAAPIAEALAGLRLVLWKRFRNALGAWDPKPVYGSVFGSAARGDGDADSDIDLLLVMASQLTARQAAKWDRQVKHLHELVPAWTGNPLQVVEMSAFEWADHRRRRTGLFTEINRDGIQVAGESSWLSVRTGPA
jgi:predicted nucleotidyltransferase